MKDIARLEAELHYAKKKAEKEGDGKNARQIFWEKGSFFETVSAINREKDEKKKALELLKTNTTPTEMSIPIPNEFQQGYSIVSKFIGAFIGRYKENIDKLDKRTAEYKEKAQFKETLPIMLPDLSVLDRFAEQFDNALSRLNIEYLSAHAATQQFLFNNRDSNDYVAQSIHEYYNLRVNGDDDLQELLLHWLNKFDVANAIKINLLADQAYTCEVLRNNCWTNIANLGRGSIQLIVLLVRLTSIIKKYKNTGALVLVEEPEQNLHPNIQALLSELFVSIYDKYNIRFVIETHSEYIIRHSQVLVAKRIYEDRKPLDSINKELKIYYVSGSGLVRDMTFTDNAKFVNPFDEGFFDQAARESLTLSRMEREFKRS